MTPIITLHNISKKYSIGTAEPYVSLRDTLTQALQFKRRRGRDEFWALKEIDFEIRRGESLGVIGHNGAGKSTLLKILSQITPPTTGKITMRGRVASLLEVGTGFHPELTGRENIFLNGAILGMSRFEIRRKFDEIVDFSGVEKFLDTPVKRYSSGMYVRLAFAVAAHLEPEILIVDEVLAVGDAEFQKKSLGKMDEVTKEAGRTIIFVSHNMEAVKKLCTRSLLLKEGRVERLDTTTKVVSHYLSEQSQLTAAALTDRRDRTGEGKVRFIDVNVTNLNQSSQVRSHDGLRFQLKYQSKSKQKLTDVRVVIAVVNDDLRTVLWLDSDVSAQTFPSTLAPSGEIICVTAAPINLAEGRYFVHINFHIKGVSQDLVMMATGFDVKTDLDKYGYRAEADSAVCNYLIPFRYRQVEIK